MIKIFNKFINFIKSNIFLLNSKIEGKIIFLFFYFKFIKITYLLLFLKKKYENKILEIYKNFESNHQNLFINNALEVIYLLKKYKIKKNISYLEIGSFEGSSAIFFYNFLTQSSITCVDTWKGSDEFSFDMAIVEKNFDKNIKELNDQTITKIKDNSENFFLNNKENFDLIYIDGDHKGISVFNDLENSFKILNNGGIIICDDFLWSYYKLATNNPAYGIGIFLKKYKKQIKIIYVSGIVAIKKIL